MVDTAAHEAQIMAALRERYFPIILPLPQNWSDEQHDKNRLSRSLAAFAIEKLADLAPAQAANCVIDGGNDNGIDAICFDRERNCLWVIQSKAGSAPDMGDNKKFCDGVRDIVNGRFEKFNAAFERIQPDVEEALATDGVQVIACHVYLAQELGSHAIADLEQLKKDLNEFVERCDWRDLNITVTHGWLTAEHAVGAINLQLQLERWYGVDTPRRAFYGLVAAAELAALYEEHGKKLFERNIRHYLGEQTVNLAIAATTQDRPEDLFYLNNGLTAVCEVIRPLPGASNDVGTFVLEGFSIVNGAQTVGSVSTVKSSGGPVSAEAKLLITLIEVGPPPDTLGPEITRARNTQNAVRGLHFAALDPQQERIRQELAVSGIAYHYRPSEEAARRAPGVITLEQATIALAGLSGSTRTVVAAKKESGQLYDQEGEYYPNLFKDSLSGVRLRRAVAIFDYLDGIFAASEQAEPSFSRRKMYYRHSRLFVLHILARRHRSLIEKPEQDLSDEDKRELSRVATELAELIYTVAEAKFGQDKGYLSIFRNLTDAEPLASDIMAKLAEQETAAKAAAEALASQPTEPPASGAS